LGGHGSPGGAGLVYIISPNIKGGYTDQAAAPSVVVRCVQYKAPVFVPPVQFTSSEPTDLSSGAYLYDHGENGVRVMNCTLR
jgi:hypothetical protein